MSLPLGFALVALAVAIPCAAQRPVPPAPNASASAARDSTAGRFLVRPGPAPPVSAMSFPRRGPAAIQAPPDRWFASDKLRHFFLSFGATGFAYAGSRAAGARDEADWLAALAALTAGLGKEFADRRHGWGFSVRDLVSDAAGIAAAILILRSG